jgi:hypothetical protein
MGCFRICFKIEWEYFVLLRSKQNAMTTVTVKINERDKFGKAIMELLRSSAKTTKNIELIEDKGAYNKTFVNKVLKSDKEDKRVRIKTDKLWESI